MSVKRIVVFVVIPCRGLEIDHP